MKAQTDFIRKNLSNFPDGFVNCVIRTFEQVKRIGGPEEAVPVSVMLYVAAKNYDLPAKICVGLLNVQGKDIYSAWCKVGDTIIDPAVFGLTNYYNSSFTDNFMEEVNKKFIPMSVPFIGTETTALLQNLSYQENIYDEDWEESYIRGMYGLPVYLYIAKAPENSMMYRIAEMFGTRYSEELSSKVYRLLDMDRIGVLCKKKD